MEREAVDEIKRHFGVIAEHLEGKIQLLAEGQEVLRREAQQFREEVRAEFQEVKAMIKFSYAELDRRVRGLETDLVELRGRVERIEARIAR
jgi:hypothetical protein